MLFRSVSVDDRGEDLVSFGYDLEEGIGILLFVIRITELIDTEHPDLGIVIP